MAARGVEQRIDPKNGRPQRAAPTVTLEKSLLPDVVGGSGAGVGNDRERDVQARGIDCSAHR